jgi:Chaperone of endosialidase
MKTSTQRIFIMVLILFSLAAVGQKAQAVSPTPDGCYPNFTTAEGCDALNLLTTGAGNTGLGWRALFSNSTGSFNTGVGGGALALNNADSNTAVGAGSLLLNTTGTQNTAVGTDALVYNDTGGLNTAVGYQALFANVNGLENTAIGDQALLNNTGNFNVAVGGAALLTNTEGNNNTACGGGALNDTTGNDNTALGFQAGILATTGNGNVYIGAGMSGVAGETNHTYVRNINTTSVSGGGTDTVTINLTTGLLGHATSSRRYKEDIKAMDNASQALFALKPVTFRYKKEIDQSQSLEYGLVAEDVAQVDPNLAIRDKNGQIDSVRYSTINAMLLNEFLKEHKAFLEEKRKVQRLEAALDAVNQRLKDQDAKIDKVSAQLETSRPGPQVVVNDP